MKFHITVIVSFVCLSVGLLTAWASTQPFASEQRDRDTVASEYNPPGHGGAYPGGTRMMDQPSHRDYV